MAQTLVETVHIYLFYSGCRWTKREGAERADFGHQVG